MNYQVARQIPQVFTALFLALGIALALFGPSRAFAAEPAGDQLLALGTASTLSTSSTSYSVQFKANGGKGTMSAQTISRGKAVALAANSFTRAGYKFVGWNTKADGTGKAYKNKAKVKNLAKANKVIKLYAQWRKSTIRELKVDTTYKKFDITGDGKADKIVVKGTAPESDDAGPGYYRSLKVYVNGKKRLSTQESGFSFGVYPQVKLVNLASGVPLLYVHYSTSNGYYAGGWLYRCTATGMKKIFDTSTVTSAYAKEYSGAFRIYEAFDSVTLNDLTFKAGSYTTSPVSYTYRYKGGKLVAQ